MGAAAQGLTQHRATVTWQPMEGVSEGVGRAQSSTRAGNSQGWTGEGHNRLAGFLRALRREGGGAQSTLPAHTARDSQLCPQRRLARGPASTRLSLLPFRL